MKIETARQFAAQLNAAADAAEAEGRDHLTEADLDLFAKAAEEGRAELAKAIAAASGA
ncbi:MAG: hypothetical protein HZC22_13365 [Rhodocyclales bacterium]|nr:hypothetical protein [Rhodocyclales bacterium]